MTLSADICSPYERTTDREVRGRIVLLKRSDGSRVGEPRTTPREMPGYQGRGPSTALIVALDRASASMRTRAYRGLECREQQERSYRMHEMALEQVEREQAAERERGK